MKRRDFIRASAASATLLAPLLHARSTDAQGAEAPIQRTPARHWEPLTENRVQCNLCPRQCQVADRERGYCGVRENWGGEYFTLVHSRPCTVRSDPIEKKPLYHYRPATDAFSLATAGCNMECLFCQNWRISQFRPEQVRSLPMSPEQVVREARSVGARSIAFTYAEPVVFYEYMYDIALVAQEQNLGRVMISNGNICRAPMEQLLGVLDAVKVDVKSFTASFYRDLCHSDLRPILDTLRLIRERGTWLEIVVLLIPGHNDSSAEAAAMSRWILQELGPDVPVHLSRFHPSYRLTNLPPTPVQSMERFRQIALDMGLRYVYLGNVRGHEAGDTYCHSCSEKLINRSGYHIISNDLSAGSCPHCSAAIPGMWNR